MIVLASTSPYRAQQLERLRLVFRQESSGVDETPYKKAHSDPAELASTLARAKAQAISATTDVIIGGDQVAALDDEIMSKPLGFDRAVDQLLRLQGRVHRLYTAVAIRRGDEYFEHLDVTELTMRSFDRPSLERYVAADRPLGCAGAYKIESLGAALFERIETDDPSSIIGLPVMALVRGLARFGVHIP